jgi:hypothetical protein
MVNTMSEAKTAYDEDAYLESADLVVWRLFNATWELGDFTNSVQWCNEGNRRFPTNFRFAACALRLLTLESADIARRQRVGAAHETGQRDAAGATRSGAFERRNGGCRRAGAPCCA